MHYIATNSTTNTNNNNNNNNIKINSPNLISTKNYNNNLDLNHQDSFSLTNNNSPNSKSINNNNNNNSNIKVSKSNSVFNFDQLLSLPTKQSVLKQQKPESNHSAISRSSSSIFFGKDKESNNNNNSNKLQQSTGGSSSPKQLSYQQQQQLLQISKRSPTLSPLQHSSSDMNSMLQRLDLRRPSIAASGMDDSPNGADMPYSLEHSLGSTPSLSSMKVAEEIDIVVIGDELSNKARFITSFLNNDDFQKDPTLDIACRRPVTIKNGTYNVNIHTTVGQEDFWGINDCYNRQGHGFVFVYNINSRESFNAFSTLRDKILYDKSSENVMMAMVGYGEHEIDGESGEKRQREVSYAEAKRLAELYQYPFTEIPTFEPSSEPLISNCISELLHRITHFNGSQSGSAASSAANGANASDKTGAQIQQTTEIMVLGELFTGKSQYIQRCLAGQFSASYRETTEWSKNIIQSQMNDIRYFIKLVDTRGLMLEESLTREKLNTTQAFIFMYSITSRNSFTTLESLRKKVLACKAESKIPCILIANKSDCLTLARQVTTQEGNDLAKLWGCPYFELSMKTSDEEDVLKTISQLLVELQKMNNNIDVGEFKKEGYLMKEGTKLKKSMTKYYFKIKRGYLYYCKNQAHTKNIKTIELSEAVQVQILNNQEKKDVWPFSLIVEGKVINLVATTEAERDQWVTSIKINCYVNEFIGNLMEDVMVTMVNEIAQQSQGQTLHKRTDSTKSYTSLASSYPSSPLSLSPDSSSVSTSPSESSSLAGSPQLHSLNSYDNNSPLHSPLKKNLLSRTTSFSKTTKFH
ncbi:pleckstrin domain-containing protein [Heterostelium album PN500]|uniref:Pleckstrin domain-containing protein n=1 Tax=Heterostelium pallidum (strain ATCC 26659 / Pp 5 / PN500) TaxID=670386 RepID=D3B4H3_HETP5|nr:pleckstrin domain-containing protein [Heterostelium album PN500]EFA84221.1 pleckstrin domain-containing protein [Heterostelium album PN500]|eukprot:XP_020436337.1 pleckstrin domain-containing protein [Heterostelium album PN500]